ncbi:Thymidylate kinase [Pyrodictium delaneyi]|uniref:Thymidylate kinase n=1 Tax=Pyrodictium delaneyi TaxID=1273541 RepID=A0A0P0N264_9CREN|nr:hypothetical protein [Pyrodictium delaneyi]ALL00789.1 Thymidylate kinase [Pyrodictium delaneyi]OWJ55575.1 hypothetical protein Pdsh_01960 [Pyrodictium delaneyi]
MPLISFIGVHGSGKTSTARLLAQLYPDCYNYRELEAIDEAHGLPPIARQLLFLSRFIDGYLRAYRESQRNRKAIVMDSHPVLVPIYSRWWLRGQAEEAIEAMEKLLQALPPADLLVYIRAQSAEEIAQRILMRGRQVAQEEANPEYISFIDREASRIVEEYGGRLARRIIVLEAGEPLEEKVRRVHAEYTRLAGGAWACSY